MKLHYRYVSYGAGPSVVEQMQQMHQLMHHMLARATPGTSGAWQPPTDVYETAEAFVVRVELAGVREEDIEITLFADYLEVSGSRRNTGSPDAAYHLAGILYGAFRLQVAVPSTLRRDDVEAGFDNGLLTVTLPKAVELAEPTTIQPTFSAATSEVKR